METPFQEILHTNAIPSDADCEQIRDLLVAAELDEEIERIQVLLKQLIGKRDHLNDFINAHLALISPARRLPEDVVAEIFTACLPQERNAVMSAADSPLLLCHVCRAWRNLALLTPRLWASLHIVASGEASKLQQINDAVELWLSRSRELPLSISFVRSLSACVGSDFSVLFATLVRYACRWRRIRFALDNDPSIVPLVMLSSADVPNLETIVLQNYYRDRDEPAWRALSFITTSSLRSVALAGVSDSIHTLISWSRLRHLFLGHDPHSSGWQTVAEGLKMLRCCPDLETCTLALTSSSPLEDVPPLCRMEHLHRLSVVDTSLGTFDFFRYLDLPNLRTLEYRAEHTDIYPFVPLLTPGNRMESLSLYLTKANPDITIECLCLVPALRELILSQGQSHRRFQGCLDTDSLWSALSPTAENLDIPCES
ncbi:hypothetical protein DFH06DRAFT_1078732 [Mycena polygramma]|nr:hypothetical protein DFH06DRAFT_1078732 [Mycena polygramma]